MGTVRVQRRQGPLCTPRTGMGSRTAMLTGFRHRNALLELGGMRVRGVAGSLGDVVKYGGRAVRSHVTEAA